MRVIFMGTPDFAVPSLEALLTKHEVVLVVTQPDKPKGRGKKMVPTPVKACAFGTWYSRFAARKSERTEICGTAPFL